MWLCTFKRPFCPQLVCIQSDTSPGVFHWNPTRRVTLILWSSRVSSGMPFPIRYSYTICFHNVCMYGIYLAMIHTYHIVVGCIHQGLYTMHFCLLYASQILLLFLVNSFHLPLDFLLLLLYFIFLYFSFRIFLYFLTNILYLCMDIFRFFFLINFFSYFFFYFFLFCFLFSSFTFFFVFHFFFFFFSLYYIILQFFKQFVFLHDIFMEKYKLIASSVVRNVCIIASQFLRCSFLLK